MNVLDLFCGAGGASVGMSMLGMSVTGVDHDADACRTHAADGHPTIRADLTGPLPLRGAFDGVWASPPCTAFSMAGKGEGREHADRLVECIERDDFDPWPDVDPAVWLILPTIRNVLEAGPRWVAGENVPQTQPVMDAWARCLERHGYRATTVVLSAERFGVAQTRKRCFLLANRDGVTTPEPTHQRYKFGEPAQGSGSLFGSVLPWVSMADALGWGNDVSVRHKRGSGMAERFGERPDRAAGEPAPAITSGVQRRIEVVLDRRCQNKDGSPVPNVPISSPSPSLTVSGVGGQFVWRSDPMPNACVRRLDQPAGTIKHGHEPPPWTGQQSENSIRLTIAEAARLQAFPNAHPWQGSRASQFRQIGNAVPPPMGAVVAGAAAGIDWQQPVAGYLADLYASPVERADGAAA